MTRKSEDSSSGNSARSKSNGVSAFIVLVIIVCSRCIDTRQAVRAVLIGVGVVGPCSCSFPFSTMFVAFKFQRDGACMAILVTVPTG